jgi:hypothetical protein
VLESGVEVVPARTAGEDERVQAAEQPQRRVPRELADDRGDTRIVGEAPAEVGVERRALLAVLRLAAEALRLPSR